jgi:hypothetical protein
LHRRRRTALVVSAATLVAAPLLSACGSQAHPGAAAVVGGDRIEVSTVQAQVADVRTAQGDSDDSVQLISKSGQLGRAKLHGLIFDRILDKASADAGVTVSRKEIQEMRQAQAAQSGGEKAWQQQLLTASWLAPSQIDAALREQIQVQKLADSLGADLQTPDGVAAVSKALTAASASLHIDVNPRFGTWNNKQTQLADFKAPWITQVTKPAQQETAAGA